MADNGNIINNEGNTIATAYPLQYYHKELLLSATKDKKAKADKDNQDEDKQNLENMLENGELFEEVDGVIGGNGQNIGISVSPAGIDNKEDDKDVNDAEENGKLSEGKIYDEEQMTEDNEDINEKRNSSENYQGTFNGQQAGAPKASNSKWWQNVVSGATVSPYNDRDEITNVGPGGGIGPGGRYNPRRAAILQRLYNDRRKSLSGKVINAHNSKSYSGWDKDWSSIGFAKTNENMSTLRVDMSKMITADKPIPAVLARSVISLGDAPVTAIVERNIYGDVGRNVIIPAGSRIIGSTDEGGTSQGR